MHLCNCLDYLCMAAHRKGMQPPPEPIGVQWVFEQAAGKGIDLEDGDEGFAMLRGMAERIE